MSLTGTADWTMAELSRRIDEKGQEVTTSSPERSFDEEVFEAFYARTSHALWAYLRRVTGDSTVADDIHQESFLRYLARPCPVADERRENAYLFRIASNLLRDRWRRERRQRGWLERWIADRKTNIPSGDTTGLRVDFEHVLGELKPRQRALLWLAYVEGHRHAEIAQILGLKEASIRVLLFRARRKLAGLLERHGLKPSNSEVALSGGRIQE